MTKLKPYSVALAFALTGLAPAASAQTGTPRLAAFDQYMQRLLSKYSIPGGSIAVTLDGRLVMANGYGFADTAKTIPIQPETRFRIASLSKAITAVTIMHLVELGKLSVDQPAFALLPDLQAPAGQTEDPRLKTITIRNLLTHSGGWDDSSGGSGFDPMFNSPTISAALQVPAPASTENIIRYMRGQPLDFNPGAHYRYSNFGYAVLGRIIEHVTGMSYEQYVRTNVLAPMGITNMRIGQSLPQGKQPGETEYDGVGKTPTVFPDVVPKSVPWAYGGWYMEAMDSHGGWIASSVDYVKFLDAIDGTRGTAFLKPSSVAAMTARPAIPDWVGKNSWYGFGLEINSEITGVDWSHNGALDGTATYQGHTYNGYSWVVFLNWYGTNANKDDALQNDVESGLWNAATETTDWPTGDYFTGYPDADPSQAAAKPALTTREGVVNGVTFDRGVVSGSWVSLDGVNLSQTTRTWTPADFKGNQLPLSLDGVSVNIDGKAAAVYYISPTRITVQAPAGLSASWVTAEVINNGVSTGTVLTHAVENAPGIMTYVAGGTTFAVANSSSGALVDTAHPANPGDTITIYASGLAPSTAGISIDSPQNVDGVSVTIGGETAQVSYAALISPALFQINVKVPNVAAGNQAIVITVKRALSQDDVFVPVSGSAVGSAPL